MCIVDAFEVIDVHDGDRERAIRCAELAQSLDGLLFEDATVGQARQRVGPCFGGVVGHFLSQLIELGFRIRQLRLHFFVGLHQSAHEGRDRGSRMHRLGRQLSIDFADTRVVLADVGRHPYRQPVQARHEFFRQGRTVGVHHRHRLGPVGLEPPTGTQTAGGKCETEYYV